VLIEKLFQVGKDRVLPGFLHLGNDELGVDGHGRVILLA